MTGWRDRGQRDGETERQRERGTEGWRDGGTEGQGTKRQRDKETERRRDGGTDPAQAGQGDRGYFG